MAASISTLAELDVCNRDHTDQTAYSIYRLAFTKKVLPGIKFKIGRVEEKP